MTIRVEIAMPADSTSHVHVHLEYGDGETQGDTQEIRPGQSHVFDVSEDERLVVIPHHEGEQP
jgi:hypothetical protein